MLLVVLCVLHACVAITFAQVNDSITIDRLHIRSDIRHRFSETLVTSTVTNNAGFAQDVTFDVRLPNEAFISGYSMLIDGVIYPGRVEEKSIGERRFQDAVGRGESAGKVVVTSARETNEFVLTVNVAAVSHVTFNLTYQELLQRRTGLYEYVIHINPGEIVPDFKVEVFINESREITELTVPEIRGDSLSSGVITGTNKFAQIRSVSPNEAEITFAPTAAQQGDYSSRGVAGQFIVNYDVDRTSDPDGELLVTNGYFVHFFAPESLPPMGKRIVFVLDTSGSMSGRKNQQLREALKFILGELRPQDEFGIVLFSSTVAVWENEGMLNATQENIDRAKRFADTIPASGGTNINAALLKGLEVLSYDIIKPSMILFLTDGQATSGVTSSDQILENVRVARKIRQSIYSLAFGSGADFGLMQKISAQNQGFARKIFEDADANLQLAGFYNEISSPLLSEVAINYLGDLVNDTTLTRSSFTTFYSGSEIVVAGRFQDPTQTPESLTVFVEGSQETSYMFRRRKYCILPWHRYSGHHPSRFWYHPPIWPCPPPPPPSPPRPIPRPTSFIERLWVYLTIKQLVGKQLEETDPSSSVAQQAKAEALKLSLKYNFVTPYTTMVATKPRLVKVNNSFGPSVTKPEASGSLPSPRQRAFFPGASGCPNCGGVPSRGIQGPSVARHIRPQSFPSHSNVAPVRGPPLLLLPPAPVPSTTPLPPSSSSLPSGLNVELNITTPAGEGGFLCLDIVTPTPPSYNNLLLLNDTENDLIITGSMYAKEYDNQRKFDSVAVIINETEVIRVSVKSVIIRGKSYRWWQLNSLNEADVTVTDTGRIELTTTNNVTLMFHKYGIETRRSLSSPYITVAIGNTENLSPETTGVIGAVLDLRDVRIGVDNLLHAVKDGVEKEVMITSDKLIDGTKCHRINGASDLTQILGL